MDAIKTNHLTKYYGKTRGVEKINLTVHRGDFFGFIGPNGAGKSTTIRMLLGLIRPSAGNAHILGFEVATQREKILERVGYLPSETAFYSGMRVQDVLKLSADLRKKDCRETAKSLCERLQLDPTRKVNELSFGNKKKIAIICALQHKPEVLILDEPTGGLDPLMQREFFEILQERHQTGATIFLSSHILSEIQRNCTHAAIIKNGSIIASDSLEHLSRNGIKRVHIHGNFDYSMLTGVKNLHTSSEGIDFLYSADMHTLLCALAKGNIQDLSITEPDLEEVFLHYYAEGGDET